MVVVAVAAVLDVGSGRRLVVMDWYWRRDQSHEDC